MAILGLFSGGPKKGARGKKTAKSMGRAMSKAKKAKKKAGSCEFC